MLMSPRMGRPPKDNPKNTNIGLRLQRETAEKLQWCADVLNVSRTEVIEQGIDLVEEKIKNNGA